MPRLRYLKLRHIGTSLGAVSSVGGISGRVHAIRNATYCTAPSGSVASMT
jgi:hypothetical protein